MENKDLNRFEETPKKENGFVKALKMFGSYLKGVFFDFFTSFKYNNMKLAAILVALPGLLIGFFIGIHYPIINELNYTYSETYTFLNDGDYDSFQMEYSTNDFLTSIVDKDNQPVLDDNGNEKKAPGFKFDYFFKINGNDVNCTLTRVSMMDEESSGTYNKFVGRYSASDFSSSIASDIEKVSLDIYADGTSNIVYRLNSENSDKVISAKFSTDKTNFDDSVTNLKFDINFSYSEYKYVLGFDYSAIMFFILMLFGILNIFTAVSMSGKKNLGSVVVATVTSSVVVIAGAMYLAAIFLYVSNLDVNGGPLVTSVANPWTWSASKIIAVLTVSLSMISSIAGCVLGYIHYDRTYEKVDR